MERRERRILAGLDIPDPYRDEPAEGATDAPSVPEMGAWSSPMERARPFPGTAPTAHPRASAPDRRGPHGTGLRTLRSVLAALTLALVGPADRGTDARPGVSSGLAVRAGLPGGGGVLAAYQHRPVRQRGHARRCCSPWPSSWPWPFTSGWWAGYWAARGPDCQGLGGCCCCPPPGPWWNGCGLAAHRLPGWPGYSQVDAPLGGYAPLLGVYGVSGLRALSAALLLQLVQPGRQRLLWGRLLLALWLGGGLLRQVSWTQPSGAPYGGGPGAGQYPLPSSGTRRCARPPSTVTWPSPGPTGASGC